MEKLNIIIKKTNESMEKTMQFMDRELSKVRAGKAQPNMLNSIMVEYYGNMTPINQVASIISPDSKTLIIKPWEKTVIPEIEKAILNSELGLNPQNDSETIIINIPPLTEERRLLLVKQIKNEGEKSKISIRNSRKESNDSLKKLLDEDFSEDSIRSSEDEIQNITNSFINKIDTLISLKEKELLTI
tara:strand:+ start:84 stop:644 length:561 start_codon:yes stop_codon:yes gene_type:complete